MNLSPHELAALLPVLLPALGGLLVTFASVDKDQSSRKWIRGVMFATAALAVLASFFYVTRLWANLDHPAGPLQTLTQPSYLQLRMDRLAQFSVILVDITAAMALMQLWDHLHHEGWVQGETPALLLFSATGMMLFAATTNLILLFVGLELMSLPLYAMTATLRTRAAAVEGGMKYFLTGTVASACFLMGAVLVYGLSGSMDLGLAADQIQVALRANQAPDSLLLAGLALMLLGFLFKVSAVPFHQWTPDAYEAAPHPVAGYMSVATKAVALIALLRVFPGALVPEGTLEGRFQGALAAIAVLTMVLGNLSALVQSSLKRMLAYSSISHAGYLLLAFVAGTGEAFTGMLYYLLAYLAMNMGAFGILSAFGRVGDQTRLEDLRGLGWQRPALGIAATLCLLSLAGIPPTAGFFGKYMIF